MSHRGGRTHKEPHLRRLTMILDRVTVTGIGFGIYRPRVVGSSTYLEGEVGLVEGAVRHLLLLSGCWIK